MHQKAVKGIKLPENNTVQGPLLEKLKTRRFACIFLLGSWLPFNSQLNSWCYIVIIPTLTCTKWTKLHNRRQDGLKLFHISGNLNKQFLLTTLTNCATAIPRVTLTGYLEPGEGRDTSS
jgi:hypothetical protein